MLTFSNRRSARAFSLIEVVIATAVFAGGILAVIGLLGPITNRVEDIIDSEIAARLSDSIESELGQIGFATAVDLTGGVGTPVTIELVANSSGDRVRLLSGTTPPANNALDHATNPGIADRERYFLVTLSRQFPYVAATSSALTLRAEVAWPYQRPAGPASATLAAHGVDADPFVAAATTQRQSLPFFFTIRP